MSCRINILLILALGVLGLRFGEEAILSDFTPFSWGSSLVQVRRKEAWLRSSRNLGYETILIPFFVHVWVRKTLTHYKCDFVWFKSVLWLVLSLLCFG